MKERELNPNEYYLSDHQILASPQMDCIYVVKKNNHEPDSNPQIVGAYAMAIAQGAPPDQKAGVSISLGQAANGRFFKIERGDTLLGSLHDIVRSGHVVVEIKGYQTDSTDKRVTSYLNGVTIDKTNDMVVAGGIGISDILSGDPLLVTLVSAPLSTTVDADGGVRQVKGVHIDYVDFDSIDFTHGPYTAKVWGFNTVLVPSGAL